MEKLSVQQEIEYMERLLALPFCTDRDELYINSVITRLKGLEKPVKYRMYQQFVELYMGWYQLHVKRPAVMSPASGKALKTIIAYFIQASPEKTEEAALILFHDMLKSWGKISPFLQQQKGLLQINKNLPEILDQIENGHSKSTTGTGAGAQKANGGTNAEKAGGMAQRLWDKRRQEH